MTAAGSASATISSASPSASRRPTISSRTWNSRWRSYCAMRVRVEVFRGEQVESRHQVDFAVFAVADSHERSTASGGERVFLRSAAKPFQAAAIVASGALDDLDAGDEMIAIVAASHSGEEKHTSLVKRLLARIGMDESALRCGVHPPFHAETAARLG